MASKPTELAANPHALPWVDDHLRLMSARVIGDKKIDHDEVFAFGTYLQTYAVYQRLVAGGKRAAAEKRYRDLCIWARLHVTRELSVKWKKKWDAMNAAFDKSIEGVKSEAEDEKLREAYQERFSAEQAKHHAAEKRLLKKHGIPDPYQ